jgi:hypothetical protein
MDLNLPAPELEYDFLDAMFQDPEDACDPIFCTQQQDVPTVSEIRLSLEEARIEDVPSNGDEQVVAGNGAVQTIPDEVGEEVMSTPQMIPFNGQTFGTKEEAREYYNAYAKRVGFSIRTGTSRRAAVTRKMCKVQFVCNKEGSGKKGKDEKPIEGPADGTENIDSSEEDTEEEIDKDEEDPEKKKKLDGGKKRKREKMQHTNCKARMVVKLIGSMWRVIEFIPDHNHELILKPSLKKFLRSHKGIPMEEKEFIRLLHGCNLTTGRIMQLMSEFYGSAQLLPYEGKDVSNFRSTIRKTEKFKDMQQALDHFRVLKEEDPYFFYKFKLDDENRVQNLYWVDGASRHAYIESYHDFVSFDATYMTNMYDMPFAPFIGINRHGQTFQLGCAFLRDEKIPSYIWLFETFLESMEGKAPLNIITDQDAAMRSAIALVFPNATHRNCRWHIMDKFSGTIGPCLAGNQELEEEFTECINYTVTPEEFETKWYDMISKHGLHDNEHFKHLYDLRQCFVPAYYMHCFFPFLQSTQRSEGFNALLKKYVNPNMSILHFVEQYQKIQDKCLVAQDGQDFRTDEKERRRWSRYPIEKHAATVYTKNLFYRFSKEFEKTAEYDVKPDGQHQFWLLPNNNSVYGYGKRTYLVTAVEEHQSYICECNKFERDGMLCCHIMRIMTRLGVKTIPEQYILKRWTQQAVPGDGNPNSSTHVAPDFVARGMPMSSKKTMRYANTSSAFAELAIESSVSDENHAVVQKHINMMRSELLEIKKRKMPVETPATAASTHHDVTNHAPAPIGKLNRVQLPFAF